VRAHILKKEKEHQRAEGGKETYCARLVIDLEVVLELLGSSPL
jgi:hypothetical protein